MTVRNEKDLYPAIASWLSGRGYYCGEDDWIKGRGGARTDRPWINIGLHNTRFDVIGARSVGGLLHDDVELAAVEVKRGEKVSVQSINQAAGYTRYVERAYFFAKPGDYSPDQVDEALRMGLGLLSVNPRARPRVRCVLDAGLSSPHPIRKFELLSKLWIRRCTLCRIFFYRYEYDASATRNPSCVVLRREAELLWCCWLVQRREHAEIVQRCNRVPQLERLHKTEGRPCPASRWGRNEQADAHEFGEELGIDHIIANQLA